MRAHVGFLLVEAFKSVSCHFKKNRQFFRLSDSGFCSKTESVGRSERNIFSMVVLLDGGQHRSLTCMFYIQTC